ncbi:MAG: glycoside hydrolase family 9 protein [Opitutaceae bacterium]|nr:glycoside hydrolase family 9 protein [Opitutaceae bacterium]
MQGELTIEQARESAGKAGSPTGAGRLRFSTHGFRPEAVKRLTVPAEVARAAGEFCIKEAASGRVVWRGAFEPELQTAASDTDECVATGDFSALTEPGVYFIELADGERSGEFRIGSSVWNEAYVLVARAMYLWRCGCAVRGEWRGRVYAHRACHLHDGYLDFICGPTGARRDATGGWHDAGDFNKYVVNAGVTVGMMFRAWEHFGARIANVGLDLPESGNGMPDLLNELRHEFDWLFKMQFEDGRVSHKLTALNFDYRDVPEGDADRRYFCPWGTAATADFVAMMALGARHFLPYDAAYAARCLSAARLSWDCLLAHPAHVEPDQGAFSTGGYGAGDKSHRLWAAVEMWETTGEKGFLNEFEKRATDFAFNRLGPVWYDVEDLALGAYLEASRPAARDAALVARLEQSLFVWADAAVREAACNAHGRPLGVDKGCFEWGGNGRVAGQTYHLHLADRLRPDPAYREAAEHALAHLFGRNFHGRSYVTGLGANPPEHPHDRRGGAWPGYLVGGPWPTARDWFDVVEDYRTNEIAINWNAALIYALAAFVEP